MNHISESKSLALDILSRKDKQLSASLMEEGMDTILHELDVYEAELHAQNHELQQQAIKIQENIELYETLFHDAPIPYILIDSTFEIIRSNRKAYEFFKFQHLAASESKKITFYIVNKGLGKFFDWISEPSNYPNQSIELDLRSSIDKTIRRFRITAKPYPSDHNWKMLTLIDIQDEVDLFETLMQKQSELIEANNVAQTALQVKSNFIANMSHEIRTPLNGVIGLTELVMRTELTPLQHDYLKKADQSARALMHVLNDLLDYAKIESGKLDLCIQPFDIRNVIQTVYEMFEYRASEKKLNFAIDLAPDIPTNLLGDSFRLNQILINLVSNAIKFTEKGSVRIKISTSIRDNEHDLLFQIIDTGIGISSDNLKNLFTPFSQVDTSFTRKYGGTGLGLAISKELIALMHGEFNVSSQEGEGSTFEFTVRFKSADAVEAPMSDLPQKSSIDFAGKYNILLVEDNDINQLVVTEKLKAYGLNVTAVNNGEDAINMVNDHFYDLIFMDIQMPVMNGFEATREIRNLQKGESVPIVALSAAVMEKDRLQALESGMNEHISKPILKDTLESILNQYLS